MKTETKLEKLNRLLGIHEKVEEVKTRTTGKLVGITEEEIQEFREAQGLFYFLAAPKLFTARICGHCGEPFLVSRKNVAFCTYTCIRMSLRKQGIEWSKGKDLELLANDPQVYNGNEPIWIRHTNLTKLKEALSILSTLLDDPESPYELSPPNPLKSGTSYSIETTTSSKTLKQSTSRSAPTTTSLTLDPQLFPTLKEPKATRVTTSPSKKRIKRKFT